MTATATAPMPTSSTNSTTDTDATSTTTARKIVRAAKKWWKKQQEQNGGESSSLRLIDLSQRLRESHPHLFVSVSSSSSSEAAAAAAAEATVRDALRLSSKFRMELNEGGHCMVSRLRRQEKDKDKKKGQKRPAPAKTEDDGTSAAANNNKRKKKKDSTTKASQPTGGDDDKEADARRSGSNHRPPANIAMMADDQAWRDHHHVEVVRSGSDSDDETPSSPTARPVPLYRTFDALPFDERLVQHCLRLYDVPTPIQAQTFGFSTTAQDFVGIAETGSGKSVAFLLPILNDLAKHQQKQKKQQHPQRSNGVQLLVLSPTRELALQIHATGTEFGSVVNVASCAVYGGASKGPQLQQWKSAQMAVATPGRLQDFLQQGAVNVQGVQYLVLDEADRMLDLGFEAEVQYIVSHLPTRRRTVMFSATWPASIQSIARSYLRPHFWTVKIGHHHDSNQVAANPRVQQTIEVWEDRDREGRLVELLRLHGRPTTRILVFVLYKKEAERLEQSLQRRHRFHCNSIHGNKNQEQRNRALEDFKTGAVPILIATDVASRGLDIPSVEFVINFTFPLTMEDYVHRIGRTGRAGKTGRSITLFQPTDKAHAGALQNVLRSVQQDIPEALSQFGNTVKPKPHRLYGNFGPKGITKAPTRIKF